MKNIAMRHFTLLFVLLLTLTAEQSHALLKTDIVVDHEWLSQHRAGIVIVDVRDHGPYLEGHIPGAINIPVNELQSKPDAILLPEKQLEGILGSKGLDLDREVVLYGEGGELAYLEYWMLDYLGMKHVHVLDGGLEEWSAQTSQLEAVLSPVVFKANPDARKYATTSYVKARLKKRDTIILDARTAAEYKGTDVRSLRGGHIPGAININYKENFVADSTKLKSLDELANIYGKLDRKKEIIVYCQTGTRAANTYVVLKELGFPRVRNYDASWIVWGTRQDLPVEDVSYINFFSIIQAIKKLESEK